MGKCKKCNGPVTGYVCDMCGSYYEKILMPDHKCGEKHCMPKCVKCSEGEKYCTCKKKAKS